MTTPTQTAQGQNQNHPGPFFAGDFISVQPVEIGISPLRTTNPSDPADQKNPPEPRKGTPPWDPAAATSEREAALQELNAWIDSDLAKSGLTRDDIEIEPFPADQRRWSRNNGGYRIIYRDLRGEPMVGLNNQLFARKRFRPPLPLSRTGVEMKYGTDPGAGNRCFLPGTQAAIDVLKDSLQPLMLVEGEKKARKATKEGLPMIGLAGIWNWLAPKCERKTVADRYKINSDLVPFLTEGREVYIIFDSDSHERRDKAKSFDLCTLRLAAELLAFGCKLFRVDMPAEGEDKCGLDDFLCRHSVDELVEYMESHKMEIPEEEALKAKDPYTEVTAQAGEPYRLSLDKEGNPVKAFYNEGWNARFFMQNHEVLYDPGEGSFYLYDDATGLWKSQSDDRIKAILSDDLRDYWKKFHLTGTQVLMFGRTDHMLKASIMQLHGLCEKKDAFLRAPEHAAMIHLPEGMLNLNGSEITLEEFSPKYYSRNMIPIHLDETKDCPRFINELLAQALSPDQIEALQKYCGMALLGYNYGQQFIILEGTAGGGKSSITEIICRIIGEENVAALRTDMLAERFEMSAFCGKTLLIANDVSSDYLRRKGAGIIKSLTGSDNLDVEFKGSNRRVRLKGNFCIAVTTNAKPKIRLDEDSDAWLRRLILIRFKNPPPEKKVPNFAKMLLKEEGSGILNWFIVGAQKALADCQQFGHIELSLEMKREAEAVVEESNTVHNFLDEWVVADPNGAVPTEVLLKKHTEYCNNNQLNSPPLHAVLRMFAKLIPEKFGAHPTNTIEWFGKRVRGYRRIALAV